MKTEEREASQKIPHHDQDSKYVCVDCGAGYYSAAPLNRLHDPYCNICGGKLVRNFPICEFEDQLSKLVGKAIEGGNEIEDIVEYVKYQLRHLQKHGKDQYLKDMKVGRHEKS